MNLKFGKALFLVIPFASGVSTTLSGFAIPNISEPAMMIIFGFGLLWFSIVGKKNTSKNQ